MRRALFLLLLAGCNRPAPSPTPVASASATAAEAPTAPADPLRDLLEPLRREVQTQEATLEHPGYQALLEPVADLLRERFPGVAPGRIFLQAIPLLGSGRAVLVYSPDSKARPAIAAFDEQRTLAWFKERPVHDLDPSIARFALCPGPNGEVFLVFHDPPTGSIAGRRWDQTGGILADFRLGQASQIDGLAALYWPDRGWLVAHSTGGAVRVQHLEERGRLAWGSEGRTLALHGAQTGPLRLALDTEVSAHVLWPGTGSTGRHHLDLRIDFEGNPLWRAPVDLGDASEQGAPRLERTAMAQLRAHLPGKAGPYIVDISAEGRVLIQ